MVTTIQSTQTTEVRVTHRHPDILKHKIAYIEQNKDLFTKVFIEAWGGKIPRVRSADKTVFYVTSMHGTMPPKRRLWPDFAISLGDVLKQEFGYNPSSSPQSVMWHFRRLYKNLYPTEL